MTYRNSKLEQLVPVEELESREISKHGEKKEKTPEEIRQDNINRMTERARVFIVEKKDKEREWELRERLAEEPEKKESTEDGVSKISKVENELEKKSGFIESIRDKFVLRKFKKAGIENPKKALEFYKYIKKKIEPDFDAGDSYYLDQMKQILLATSDPIAFYEKLYEIDKIKPISGMNDLNQWVHLMKDSKAIEKLDKLKEVISRLGPDRVAIFDYNVGGFCNNEELQVKLSDVILERLRSLLDSSDTNIIEFRNLSEMLGMVEGDDIFEEVSETIKERRKKNERIYLTSLADEIKVLQAEGITKAVLKSRGVNFDSSSFTRELSSYSHDQEYKGKLIEEFKALHTSELSEDEDFRKFSDDFSVITGGKFNLENFSYLRNLYLYHKDYALAFFEAFRGIGLLEEDKGGDLDIKKIDEAIGRWKNENATSPEIFFAMLEPKFQEKLKRFKELKKNFKKEDLFAFSRIYVKEPEFMNTLETPAGKELFDFFTERGIDPISRRDFFLDPGTGEILKDSDEFIEISKNWNLDILLEICEDKEKAKGFIGFLKENNFKSEYREKFTVAEIDLLMKVYDNRNILDLELFKKDFHFFFNDNVLDILIKNPEKIEETFNLSRKGFLGNKNLSEILARNILNNDNIGEHFDKIKDILLSAENLSVDEFEYLSNVPRDQREEYFKVLKKTKALKIPFEYFDTIMNVEESERGETIDVLIELNGYEIQDEVKRIIIKRIVEVRKIKEYWSRLKKYIETVRNSSIDSDIEIKAYLMKKIISEEELRSSEEAVQEVGRIIEIHKKNQKISQTFSDLLDGREIDNVQLKERGIPEIGDISHEYLAFFDDFRKRYEMGEKGKTIVALASMSEAKKLLESQEGFSWEKLLENTRGEMEKYQEVIEGNSFKNIPEGLRATIGMEYEITNVIKEAYQENNFISYKKNILAVSDVARVGEGGDAVHEIFTQPTDNPFLMLLEMKLLQDLGFIDFNFKSKELGGYYGAATGYHLSIGGEWGVDAGYNANFLSNVLSMSNWGGANFEKAVSSVGRVRPRGTDSQNVFLLENQSPSVEMRNFSIDRWEPFERTILTSYNSSIAIQALERYVGVSSFQDLVWLGKDFPRSADELYEKLKENNLIKEPLNEPVVKELIFTWLRFQVDALQVIKDHNENFLTNEIDGYLNDKGEWIDAKESSGRDNRRYFQEGLNNFNKSNTVQSFSTLKDFFEQKIKINPSSVFENPHVKNTNAITYIGNLFLTKFSNFKSDQTGVQNKKADPNVLSFLENTRKNGVRNEARQRKDVEKSVFDRNGELPQDYYYLQGGSEKLIIHQIQKLLIKFNQDMAKLLKSKKEEMSIAA